ncbi:MAG: hypothetical protein FWG50_08865 [Kiritimatiellaeota bacterium]|nr:hypothetical protein [Kiritimatiellota bacterium]
MFGCDDKNVWLRLLGAFLLLGVLALSGCMCDTPNDTELPWNAPSERDAMMPLPNSMLNRYN